MRFFTFVRTKADPLPGLTCKNSKILQGLPERSLAREPGTEDVVGGGRGGSGGMRSRDNEQRGQRGGGREIARHSIKVASAV